MGIRMPRHGIMLPHLLFRLLQIQTAVSVFSRRSRLSPLIWDLVDLNQQQQAPYSSTVRMRQYNFTRLVNREVYPGIGSWGGCTGTVIAWNIVLTAAHCFYPDHYPIEYVEMWPGGLMYPGNDPKEWENGEAPLAFGSYIAYVAEDVFIHPDWINPSRELMRSGYWDPSDLAVIVLETPIQKAPESDYFDPEDASMKLSMLQSFIPADDDPEYPADPVPSFDVDQITFYHFPQAYPMLLKAWGRMHYSHSQPIEIQEGYKGMALYKLASVGGSSGASIQEKDVVSDEAGGSASGARIRIINTRLHSFNFPMSDGTYGRRGILLGPNHLRWIAGIMDDNQPLVSDLDTTLATGLETQVCMCVCDDGHITVKVVGNPFDTNCICATGCAQSMIYDVDV